MFKIVNPANWGGRPGDEVTLWYNGKFRCGTVERLTPTYMVVHTGEGYRSFKYDKIENMRLFAFSY
jgi:hypothetical protein